MSAAIDFMADRQWVTVGTGAIFSAALPILASGGKGQRSATKSCRFLAHVPRLFLFGDNKADDLDLEATELRRYEELYCGTLGRCSNRPWKWWHSKIKNGDDWYFDAKEALSLGVIDSVL